MKPNYILAATKALEVLIENQITETPIDSFSILLKQKGIRVVSFTKYASLAGIKRHDLVPMFGSNQDACTFTLGMDISDVRYVVVYNMRLPYEIIQRGIARELGHIVLGHDGETRPTSVRMAEAMCFAHHLISPRPVIKMLQDAFPVTMNVLTDTTGCSDDCVDELREIPGVSVSEQLNREVRDLFAHGIDEYIRFHKASLKEDHSHLIDFGSYMNGYAE